MADEKAKGSDKAKAPVIIIKKSGHGGHGHHGGAWKVAYADFVTAMMAFFLVMWLMGADEETKQAIEKYFTQATDTTPMNIQITDLRSGEQMAQMDTERKPAGRPVDLPAGKHSAETQEDSEIREKIEEALSVEVGVTSLSEDIKIVQGQDNESVVRIAIKDLFRAGSSRAESDLLPLIQRLGKIVSQSGRAIRIEGHADKHETSDTGGNLWELSNARAAWLADYWVNHLNDSQLGPRLQVMGHGSHKPVEKGDSPQGQAANRRIEVIVLKGKPTA